MSTPVFNPALPLPRKSLRDVMATGAAQAEWGRLYAACVGGTFGALAILLLLPAWWLAATPLICLASFAGWGLAAQKTIELDRRQQRAPSTRAALHFARWLASATGALSALALLFGIIAALMQSS